MTIIPDRVIERALYIGDLETDSNCLILAMGRLKYNATFQKDKIINKQAIIKNGDSVAITAKLRTPLPNKSMQL